MVVLALFFASGAASLGLEIVFRRELALYLGSEVTATSITLATFLLGLALGAALIGPRADRTARPLRLYAWLELGVGFAGAIAVALLAYGRPLLLAPVRTAGPGATGLVVAAMIAAALLLPPTVLMGGTLPALTRHVLRAGGPLLRPVATLYGVNTLGAAFGAALAGFVLIEAVGVSMSGWLCAGLAGGVGVVALALDRRSGGAVSAGSAANGKAPKRPAIVASTASRRTAMLVVTVSGAVALGYEVVWTRLLVLPLRSYAYSFSLMLALFLMGLVIGALILARVGPRIENAMGALAFVQLAGALFVASSVLWMPFLLTPAEGRGFGAFILGGLRSAGPVVLPPTILSGMALPLAIRVFAGGSERPGAAVGTIYAANTFGAIVGAVVAGLVLLPALGAPRALTLLATLGAGAGTIAAFAAWQNPSARSFSLAVAAACAMAIAIPMRPFTEAFSRTGRTAASSEALFYSEGATDTVAVVRRAYGFRDADAKSVIVNGIAMTATVKPVWRYMAAEGHLPALFAPQPCRGLVICVGTGITLSALAAHAGVTAIDAVDLSESMLAALPTFDRENRSAYRDRKVELVHADGRHFLELTDRRYGVITLEPPPPIVAGSVHLYTLDFYKLCSRRLETGGVVAQWLPFHAQSLASAKATARTFLAAYPYVALWLPSIRDAVLLGSDRPLHLDTNRVRAAYAAPATRESLSAAYLETAEALLSTYLLDRDGVERWSAGADLITDDRPRIEFFRRYGGTMSDREIGTLLAPPYGSMGDLLGSSADAALLATIAAERDAHLAYLEAEVADDPRRSRDAALLSRATSFGLYRLGCDGWQLAALRDDPAGPSAWQKQVALCQRLVANR